MNRDPQPPCWRAAKAHAEREEQEGEVLAWFVVLLALASLLASLLY